MKERVDESVTNRLRVRLVRLVLPAFITSKERKRPRIVCDEPAVNENSNSHVSYLHLSVLSFGFLVNSS